MAGVKALRWNVDGPRTQMRADLRGHTFQKGRCRWIGMGGRIWGSICLVISIFLVKARVEGDVFGRFEVRTTVRKSHGKALCKGKLEFISLEMFPFFYLPIINSNK